MHSTEEMQASKVDFRDYVKALEVEKQKIQVFQRELPLCLELVTQAIERCKQELSDNSTEFRHGQSECSEQEQTSSEGHVFEEFIPMKRTSSSDSDDDELHESDRQTKISDDDKNNSGDKKKSEWLRSVQLWSTTPDPLQKEELPRKALVVEVKRNGGAFQPFHRAEKSSDGKTNGAVVKSTPLPATSSTTDTGGSGGNSKKEDKEGQRKQRRNWSPELHRRFLHALQQLGGSHTATPKQIRELMKVDGLTNDEVKSHLQKYRLHTRRPTIHNNSNNNNNNNGNAQAPQFVVVGGIWVPPQDYNAAVAAANTASGEAARVSAVANGIYAPVASTPSTVTQVSPSAMHRPRPKKPEPSSHSEERTSHSGEGRGHSTSTATSPSSTHTSPVF